MPKKPTYQQMVAMGTSGFFSVFDLLLISVSDEPSMFSAWNGGFCFGIFVISFLLWVLGIPLKRPRVRIKKGT